MAVAAVIVSWIAGFMAPTVWVINQPLWFAIPITVISLACVPLMVAALWATDGDGGQDESG
jgi:hypothetical protein